MAKEWDKVNMKRETAEAFQQYAKSLGTTVGTYLRGEAPTPDERHSIPWSAEHQNKLGRVINRANIASPQAVLTQTAWGLFPVGSGSFTQYLSMTVLHSSQMEAGTLVRWLALRSVIFTKPSAFFAFSNTPGTSFAKLNAPSLLQKRYPSRISFPHSGHFMIAPSFIRWISDLHAGPSASAPQRPPP